MNTKLKKLIKTYIPEAGEDVLKIKTVIDHANNKIYLQTEPFLRDGKVIVKRVAEVDFVVEKAYSTVEEYTLPADFNE